MIDITTSQNDLRCICNSCRVLKADIEIRFSASGLDGGYVVSLCNKCAHELKESIEN